MPDNAGITFAPAVDGPEIPPLEGASENGFREIARIWQSDIGNPDGRVTATLRRLHAEPQQWVPALAMFARTIAALYGNGTHTEAQIDALGGLLLLGSLQLIASTSEPEAPGEPPAVQMIRHQVPPEPACPTLAKEDIRHPGELPLPEPAAENADAKEILSVWVFPEVKECPGCGENHPQTSYTQGQASNITPEELGVRLADATTLHATHAAKDAGSRLKVLADIQKAYHDALTAGMARQ